MWIGQERHDFTISYNDFHHFYDIRMFHILKNKEPSRHIDEAIAVLQSDGITILQTDTIWRSVSNMCSVSSDLSSKSEWPSFHHQIFGKRIWIKAQLPHEV